MGATEMKSGDAACVVVAQSRIGAGDDARKPG